MCSRAYWEVDYNHIEVAETPVEPNFVRERKSVQFFDRWPETKAVYLWGTGPTFYKYAEMLKAMPLVQLQVIDNNLALSGQEMPCNFECISPEYFKRLLFYCPGNQVAVLILLDDLELQEVIKQLRTMGVQQIAWIGEYLKAIL